MKDFLKILKWFERNAFKLIFIPISIIIILTIVMFLIPIFQFVGFVGDGFNQIQNIFQEILTLKFESEHGTRLIRMTSTPHVNDCEHQGWTQNHLWKKV